VRLALFSGALNADKRVNALEARSAARGAIYAARAPCSEDVAAGSLNLLRAQARAVPHS
jgi:hypothetical protein